MKLLSTAVILEVLVSATLFAQATNIFPSSGNVGIGTTAPATPLELLRSNSVVQRFSSGFTNHYMDINNANDGVYRYWYFSLGSATTDEYIFFNRQNGDPRGIAARNYGGNFNRVSMFHNDAFGAIQTTSNTPLALQAFGGNVGIGTAAPQYKLAVNGQIGAKEVIVTNSGWADYVFKSGYRLQTLSEVSAYIKHNHHLPDIPEDEVKNNGVGVGEMQAKLLAKIEELTLHMIEADRTNTEQQQQILLLREENRRIRKSLGDNQ